jgi:transitional endoplasmic reticulum ATPase
MDFCKWNIGGIIQKMKQEKLILEIVEAGQKFVGKNLVTISSIDMEKLGIVSGDLVSVGNEKKIHYKAIRASEDTKGLLSMDGGSRSALGLSVGERVSVEKSGRIETLKSITITILPNENYSTEQLKSFNSQLKNSNTFHDLLINSPISIGQKITIPTSVGKLTYEVTKCMPKKLETGFVRPATKIDVSEEVGSGSGTSIYYEDIGGLKDEIEKIREMVEFPMKHPDIFQKLGINAPKGVLLTGPPGTGKTLLAKAVATETDSNFISIAGPEIMSKYHGGSEENLRSKFEDAEKNAPSIVFIDEIDAIAPKRGETNDQAEKRVVTQLLTLMDGLKGRGQVVVMAATNRPDDLDEALRRPGRFDREIRINPPSEEGRKEILKIHTRNMPLEGREEIINNMSGKTLGYTGADLEVICKEAALRSVKPLYKEIISLGEQEEYSGSNEEIKEKKQGILAKILVTQEDFEYALKNVEPSAMREVLINKPHVKWDDVGGLEEAKEKLKELVELPLKHPELFVQAGIKPSKGILLSGPPGTGKTLLAKAVATESKANFISVKGPELVSKWVGESEKHVREIFKKARQVAPCIIFFDEFDSISKMRGNSMNDSGDKIMNQMLTELDGVEELEKVVIMAATNRKDLIDPAILRPGRIDSHVELGIPDEKTRVAIFEVHTKKMPFAKGLAMKDYISKSDGWTGADIEALARNAGINAIKRYHREGKEKELTITKEDFEVSFKAIKESKKSDEKQELPDMEKMQEMMKGVKGPEKDKSKIKKGSKK